MPGTKLYYVELVKDYTGLYKGKSYEKWAETLIAMAMDVNKPGGVVIDFAKIVDKVKLWEGYVPPPGRTHQGLPYPSGHIQPVRTYGSIQRLSYPDTRQFVPSGAAPGGCSPCANAIAASRPRASCPATTNCSATRPPGADAPPPRPPLLLPPSAERVSRTRRRSERLNGRASLQNKVP